MTHPISLTRPLLVQLLAATVLCPVAFARPKSKPEAAKPAEASLTSARKTEAGRAVPKPTKAQLAAAAKAEAAKAAAAKAEAAKAAAAKAAAAKAAAAVKPNTRKPAKAPQTAALAKSAQGNGMAAVPQQRQTQGDAPRVTGQEHLALIIPPEELRARVPAYGMLNEEDCILLAISTSPELQKRRAQIQDAIADRQAEKDWKNPELRLSYGSQSDDYLRNPYVERTTENLTETEDQVSNQSTTSLSNPGEFGFGESTTDQQTGTTTTSRFREIERIVTPGRFGDTVTTNVYETRTEASTGVRDRTVDNNGFIQTRRDALAENVERTLRSTATETTSSSAENGSQETFSAVLRLQMPHPWVKKAKLARAAAEITLAEAQYLADEDKLVREIRALFQDLSVKQSTLKAHQRRRENFAAFRTEMEGAPIADFAADAARASIDMADVLNDSSKVSSEANNVRAEIALLCGISQPGRIYTPGIVSRRILDYRELNQSYLVEMAMLYRADAVESRGRLGIAKALLEEAKAAKIPWATFIDAGYTRQWRDGYSGEEDEWMIRVGIEIPFFDWTGINKRGREYKKAAVQWEKQFNQQRERIESQVAVALDRVKRAYSDLRKYDDDVKREQASIKDRLAKVEAVSGGLSGLAKNLRIKYDAEDATQILEIGRYRAYSDYNEAMMKLEDTIGIRIEKVLSRAGK